ncbi:MAG TPA: UDP-2,3-diacylglucosamine diphosphatase LpxI [Xanthobacteraceae bacterium]|nr:UDP-2,3-diacylglucosamine diphosphatase LpxI [Xanthobacteraceae bacterium]
MTRAPAQHGLKAQGLGPAGGAPGVNASTSVQEGPLAIVAGGGAFPAAVAEAVRAQGRDVLLLLMKGFADPALERYPHHWFRLGSLGSVSAVARARGVRDVVMVGTLTRPRLSDLGLDWTTIRLLPRVARLLRGGDNHLLSGVLGLVAEQGFHLIGAHEAVPGLLLPEGVLGHVQPSAEQQADIALGLSVVHTLGPFDVGQGVIVVNGFVAAVEAAEGTDAVLARYEALRTSGRLRFPMRAGVLVKAPKPDQDRRVDLPSLGPGTVACAARAGLAGIAFEAGGVIVPDPQELVRAADAAGLFVLGVAPGGRA